MKSMTLTVPPILGCLRAAEKHLNRECKWTPHNDAQRDFLERFAGGIPATDEIADVLKSIAHKDASVINAWLKEHGFDIELEPGDGMTFSVASILDVLVEWLEEGEVETITTKRGKSHVGVKVGHGFSAFSGNGKHPVAQIRTKGKELVHMAMVDKPPKDALEIAPMIAELSIGLEHDNSYESVTFPMVDYDQHVDISWIEGLATGTSSSDYCVDQAIQQTKFRMNEFGARVQSAAAMTMRCMAILSKRPLVIDGPFLLWIERPGCKMPLFAGFLAEDCWGRPRDIRAR